VICSLRLLLQSILFFNWAFFNLREGVDVNTALSVLFLGMYLGGYLTGMFYLSSILSASYQKRLLKLINFLQHEDPSFAKPTASNRRGKNNMTRDKFYLRNEVLFYYFLSVIMYTVFTISNTTRIGIDLALERVYTNFFLNGPMSIVGNYPSLKRAVSYICLWCQIDQERNLGIALVFSIVMAKTLEDSVAHFVRAVNDKRKYCLVTKEEVSYKNYENL
ncbi:unnamed protein product, partial [Orchesella dallaii]